LHQFKQATIGAHVASIYFDSFQWRSLPKRDWKVLQIGPGFKGHYSILYKTPKLSNLLVILIDLHNWSLVSTFHAFSLMESGNAAAQKLSWKVVQNSWRFKGKYLNLNTEL
jgi:hypothetical protein